MHKNSFDIDRDIPKALLDRRYLRYVLPSLARQHAPVARFTYSHSERNLSAYAGML